jgi:4-amino-4-deoxy-L-arabinose transferase-like glycosyltransferase
MKNKPGILISPYLIFGSLLVVFLSVFRIQTSPPLWWDEGWTLMVAKNWIELGHYGQLLNAQPRGSGLSASFPIIAPIALSFKLFGIGVWQARMVGVIFTFGTLALVYYLSKELFNRPVALGTLFVLLFFSVHPRVNPIINGRQVLADIPMLFYLLLGFVFLGFSLKRSKIFILPTIIFWGIAINTKVQTLPFWSVALFLPFSIALIKREKKLALCLGVVFFGSIFFSKLGLIFQNYLLQGHTLQSEQIKGLTQIVAFVLDSDVRARAILMVIVSGIPVLIGLVDAFRKLFNEIFVSDIFNQSKTILKLALFGFTGSWFAWFVLLSNGGDRYLTAPFAIGAMFFADYLYIISGGYNWRAFLNNYLKGVRFSQISSWNLSKIFFLVFLLAFLFSSVGGTVYFYFFTFHYAHNAAVEVADFINTNTPKDSLIETYESELFFFLDRPYHYPPDQIHVDLLRRSLVDPSLIIPYDPLEANPDFIVLGAMNSNWRLYDQILQTGQFTWVKTFGPYQVYKLVRDESTSGIITGAK